MIRSLAIPFRNYAHRLRTRFDQRTGHDGTGLRSEGGGLRAHLPREGHRGRWNRPELQRLLDHLRKGDVLVVWKLDRLSRSLRDVLTIMERIQEAKAGFRSLTEAIDTTTPAGRMMMQMIGSFAEFERAMLTRTNAGGPGIRPCRGPYWRASAKAAASATDRGGEDGREGKEDRGGCSSTLQCPSRNHSRLLARAGGEAAVGKR